jgi:hypothetical protein
MPPRQRKLTAQAAANNLDEWFSLPSTKADWQIAMHPGGFAWANMGGGHEGRSIPVYFQIIEPPEGVAPGLDRRFVRAFTPDNPDGEVGTISIAYFWGPLTEAEFARARVQRWPLRSHARPTVTATLRSEPEP